MSLSEKIKEQLKEVSSRKIKFSGIPEDPITRTTVMENPLGYLLCVSVVWGFFIMIVIGWAFF